MKKAIIAATFFGVADADCFSTGFQYKNALNGATEPIKNIADAKSCQTTCKDTVDCHYFSYWPTDKHCWLYGEDPGTLDKAASDLATSGPQECPPGTPSMAPTMAPTAAPTMMPTMAPTVAVPP